MSRADAYDVIMRETPQERVELRDQFATAALVGLVAKDGDSLAADYYAKLAYRLANAMLKARTE
jgi:hypothetical protein